MVPLRVSVCCQRPSLPRNNVYIDNVAYLINIAFVTICKKKNHVIFYHLEFICTAEVSGIVKKKIQELVKIL